MQNVLSLQFIPDEVPEAFEAAFLEVTICFLLQINDFLNALVIVIFHKSSPMG